jgi:hypothetical protein
MSTLFVRDIWRHYSRVWRRRRLLPYELAIVAYGEAKEIVDAYVGNTLRFLGAPSPRPKCALAEIRGGARPSAALADQAAAAVEYLDKAGDDPTRRELQVKKSRRAMNALASVWLESASINDLAAERWLAKHGEKLSHTQIREHRLSRSMRIMRALHDDCPDLWCSKCRPVADMLMAPPEDQRVLLAA